MTFYLGTNATPQERIERGEAREFFPAVEELLNEVESVENLKHQIELIEEELYSAKELLNEVSQAVENRPFLKKLFNTLVEASNYEF